MRLQLKRALALAGFVAFGGVFGGVAHADGTLTARGAYYKERSTRVMQPMLDGMFEVGARGMLQAHFVVDAITSASAGSGAVDAKPFTETRYEAGGSYLHELDGPANSIVDKLRVGGDAKFSTESDYQSVYGGGRLEASLAQNNAVLALGGGVGYDTINNAGLQNAMGRPPLQCNVHSAVTSTDCNLLTLVGFASASQVLSKNALAGVSYDISRLDGFQANAYRQVITAGGLFSEAHPNERLRQSIAGSVRYFVPRTQTTLIGSYRYYWDNWHIHAHTPELRIVQQVGANADATLGYRYYRQSAAYFFKDRYPDPMPGALLTDDAKMSAFTGGTILAKLGILGEAFDLTGRWGAARFEGVLEYIVQHNRFGNAVEAHVALTLPFDY